MSEHHRERLAALHQTLLHGKLPRNLHWSEALELVAFVGQVEPISGTEYAFVVGTQREFFKRSHGSELGVEEVSRLRRLLKTAGAPPVRRGFRPPIAWWSSSTITPRMSFTI